MNNLFFLIKANVMNSWGINKLLRSKSRGDKVKAVFMGIAVLYAFCGLFFAVFMMNYPLGQQLEKLNALELMLGSSILSTTLISLIMSIYKIPGYLFSFRDYDLLMSLPLKPSAVLASKMIFIYLSNLAVSVVLGVPSLIIFGMKTDAGVVYYIFAAAATLINPLIPISIGALFAYILGRISARFRATNALLLIGSFAFFIALMIGPSLIGRVNAQQVQNSLPAINNLIDILFWTRLFILALKESSFLYLAAFILVSLVFFGVFISILSKGFKSINSKMSEKYKASNYKITSLKTSGVLKALYIKELRFYFSSYIYVMNTAFGVVMMFLFSIGIAFFGKDTVARVMEIPMADAYMAPVIALVFAFCIIFTFTTAPSISIEGKNLWIIKSLPLKTADIFWGKILLNLTLTVPTLLINTVIVAISFKMDAETVFALFLVCLMYSFISPVIGLIINLYFPKMEWTSHIAVVKQSASVLLNMLAGFIILAAPIGLFVLVKPSDINLFIEIFSVVLLMATFVFIKVLKTAGIRKFQGLQ
jgi:ABC-2 type transport system permease protein